MFVGEAGKYLRVILLKDGDTFHDAFLIRLRMGIFIKKEQIFTSGTATAMYLKTRKDCRRLYVLGTKSFEKEFKKAGFILTDKKPDYVVLGFDKTLTYEKLEKACLFILNGVKFIASHPDKTCPMEYGYIPDCGAMISLIFETSICFLN